MVEESKEREGKKKAREVMAEEEKQEDDQLTVAKQKADKGDATEALKAAEVGRKQFAGADAAREATEFAATLTNQGDNVYICFRVACDHPQQGRFPDSRACHYADPLSLSTCQQAIDAANTEIQRFPDRRT